MKDAQNQIHGHGHHPDHGHDQKPHPNGNELFVDNDRYEWESDTITGAQLRVLASLPEDVEIFHKVPVIPTRRSRTIPSLI